jgi:hypothetical protein
MRTPEVIIIKTLSQTYSFAYIKALKSSLTRPTIGQWLNLASAVLMQKGETCINWHKEVFSKANTKYVQRTMV